jgi:peptidyl-prolyl cis-trans isomerase A (cyclophilin A)
MKRPFLLILFVTAVMFCPLNALRFARWSTSLGSYTAELYDQLVPITANNFIDLANSGFYNGLVFHRVIEGFVIQDGCPYGTGYGGPGYTIPDEFHPDLHHDQAGILAMARTTAPNSAGSQYYITLAPQPHLDGNYAIFGKVIQGLDVVMAIGSVPTDADNHPLTPVTIDTLRILDLAIGSTTPPDNEVVNCILSQPQMFIIEASAQNSVMQYDWYVDGILQGNSLDFIFETAFAELGSHVVECAVSSADWQHSVAWEVQVNASGLDGIAPPPPQATLELYPNPFSHSLKARLYNSGAGNCRFSVYDLRGRLVNSPPAGSGNFIEWEWDGCDEAGNRLSPGVYVIRAELPGATLVRRCLMY